MPSPPPAPLAGALLLAALLAACTPAPPGWDGRRGYDGNGDYGYDLGARGLLASRAEAGSYRAGAASRYAVPGPPEDPWGPHLREASTRFGVPEGWLRAIMRQESGGRLFDGNGLPITSPVGAMGLMQVMPRTYDTLRARHGLGPDPYEPRDNILAGAAYIREMHDRFGAPGFAAAYNAGPDRVEAYLAGAKILPDETINYVASVAPQLGLAGAGGGAFAFAALRPEDDPSRQAFDGGGLVTPEAPTGVFR
ncbi:lytic transglycosylase domain-containing protein [Roseomonas nepalensis]|uniref:Lytic transglycosylase domain-containing protein n=1 Tax=Muricoccus nepalensis TaxID=1854500 RepID=A0A502G4N9_9PROT|nr:lytic transglycosylase domain-containing protein [Roseomonas nepalensis]